MLAKVGSNMILDKLDMVERPKYTGGPKVYLLSAFNIKSLKNEHFCVCLGTVYLTFLKYSKVYFILKK